MRSNLGRAETINTARRVNGVANVGWSGVANGSNNNSSPQRRRPNYSAAVASGARRPPNVRGNMTVTIVPRPTSL